MTSTKLDLESTEVEILKADSVGRVHRTPQEIDAILDEFEASSMSGAQFARHYGLKYPTFASWRAKIIFDQDWADRNGEFANSIIRFANRWDVLFDNEENRKAWTEKVHTLAKKYPDNWRDRI